MTNLSQIFPEKKERTDFWIAIAVIIIFLTAILYYLFGSGKTEAIASVAAVEQSTKKMDDFDYETKTPIIYNSYDAKTEQEEVLDTLVASVEKDSVPFQKTEVEVIKETIISKPEPTIEKPIYVEEDEDVEVIKEEATATPAINNTKEETAKIEETNQGLKLKGNTSDQTYGCIVIIGSFKEPANSKVLISKLKKQNLPVYEGIYKGYYIVGVNSDCEKSKITPLLKTMQKQYEKSAWIYKR